MKIRVLFIFSIISLLFASCEDILQEEPLTFLSPDKLQSEEGVVALLKGAYASMQEYGYYKQDFIMQAEMRADYMHGRGSYQPVGDFRIDARNIGRITDAWNSMYSGVNLANTIIASLPELEIDEDVKKQAIAEAKVLRGLHYYNLVRTWGEVPLRLIPVASLDDMNLGKSSVTDIYNQIVTDLEDAVSSIALPESYPATDRGRATVYAAKALLADVYLTIGQYNDAATTANQVISSGKFSLEEDLATIFSPEDNATHSGEIWSIIWVRQGNDGNRLLSFMHNTGMGYSRAGWRVLLGNLDSPIINSWEDADQRKAFNLYISEEEQQVLSVGEPMLFRKFIDPNGAGQDAHGNDQPVFRYADVLTIFAAAECLANNGPTVAAYEALNQVRRRGYGVDVSISNAEVDYTGLSQNEFMDAVWNERAHEFMMEGKRWYDMKRMPQDKAIALINTANKQTNFNSDDWLYPIPQAEIDNNDGLTNADQNPGY